MKKDKGQEFSKKKLWCLQFSQKTNENISLISALASKKWLNEKNIDTLLYVLIQSVKVSLFF